MKKFLSIAMIFLVVLSTFSMFPPQVNAAVDNTLVVYIGAHPDDIDIGMSGSLYKYDVGIHPILWIVVTDGGADDDEYAYETTNGWIAEDAQYDYVWIAPDGNEIHRPFYSADLSRKRCGGYVSGSSWINESATHQSEFDFGTQRDWRSRVDNYVGSSSVEKKQVSYLDPNDPTRRWLYPDGGLHLAESVYTSKLAYDLAFEIQETVNSNGYRTDLLYINSHACEEIARNAYEHNDHGIVGNAVRKALDYLQNDYGFGRIAVTWYTIYSPIEAKGTYTIFQEDISAHRTQKSDLNKAVWETDYMENGNFFDRASEGDGYWNEYPTDPGDYEYVINLDYPRPIFPETLTAILGPGETVIETKTINLPAKIPRADILLSFDVTGSMGDDIAAAKARAVDIMNQLDEYISDARYGVVSYSDYPHYYSSYGYSDLYGGSYDHAYRLEQPLTYDRTAIANAINSLSTKWGADGPQDYTRIMYESYADPDIEWRVRVKRILLNFGDNVPHDNNLNEGIPGTSGTWSTGGDPGRDEVMFTDDDLDLQAVINEMVVHGITMLHVHGTGPGFGYWQHWTDWTDGSAYYLSDPSGIVDAIAALVGAEVSYLSLLTLECTLPTWLTSVSPSSYSDLELPVSVTFEIEVTAPADTESGTYVFEIIAIGDGVSYGEQFVEITVPGVEETTLKVFPLSWQHFIMDSPFETLNEAYEYLEETKENGYPSPIEGGWGTVTFDLSIENEGDVGAENVMIEVMVDVGEVTLKESDWATGEFETNTYDVEPYTINSIHVGDIPASESRSISVNVPLNYASLTIAKHTTGFCPEVTFTDFSTGFIEAWTVTVRVSSNNADPVTQTRWLWGWDLEWLATFSGETILKALECAAIQLFKDVLRGLFLADLSGCHIQVYDSTGAHVGLNPDGTSDYDLPAFLITIDNFEAILLLEPEEEYVIEVQGTETGTYSLHLMYALEGEIMGESVHTGGIAEGDTYVFMAQFDEDEMTVTPEDTNPPSTELTIGQPRYDALPEVFVSSETPFTLSAEDNLGGTGVYATSYRIRNVTYSSGWITSSPPMSFWVTGLNDGMYNIDYNSTDNVGNVEPTNTITVVLDNSGPSITVSNPPAGWALQDGVTFLGSITDSGSGVFSMSFSIREANDDDGIPIGLEDLPVSYDPSTGEWSFFFDTLLVPDGYYVLYIEAEDNLGNEASTTVPYSIRNWAVIELLPSSRDNKAGRTMPVKFALRVVAEVDPAQPFVYNEELRIEIYATDNPTEILQESYFGDTARDYRISSVLYITNFKTLRTPMEYTVTVYRDTFDVGSFTFETVK